MRIILLLFLAGCFFGGCSQDPLKDLPDRVKNGVPASGKPVEQGEAVSRDKILIELKHRDNLIFQEAVEKTINFDVRVLDVSSPKVTVNIENLPEGAIFDPKDNAFTWTPAENYVQNDTGIRFHFLEVEVIIPETIEKKGMKRIEQFRLEIHNQAKKPEILSFILSASEFLEGDKGTFTAKIRDYDSSTNLQPDVRILESDLTYYKSAAYFVSIDSVEQDEGDSTLWHVKGDIDTSRAPIQVAGQNFRFGIRTVSRYGIYSESKMSTFKIIHKPISPIVTNNKKTYTMVRGKGSLTIDFDVVSVHPADKLSVEWETDCSSLKDSVQCHCDSLDWVFQTSCQVMISPDTNTPTYSFKLKTKVRNYYYKENILSEVYGFDVNVVEPEAEEPLPTEPPAGEDQL